MLFDGSIISCVLNQTTSLSLGTAGIILRDYVYTQHEHVIFAIMNKICCCWRTSSPIRTRWKRRTSIGFRSACPGSMSTATYRCWALRLYVHVCICATFIMYHLWADVCMSSSLYGQQRRAEGVQPALHRLLGRRGGVPVHSLRAPALRRGRAISFPIFLFPDEVDGGLECV